jgi:hypothetical protein
VLFPRPLWRAKLPSLPQKQNRSALLSGHLLPDEDSNLDKQNQNLSYYHYTIGQSLSFLAEGDLASQPRLQKGVQK